MNALGAHIEELHDGLVICGVETLCGGVSVDACNDHRIAMMAAVAATRREEPVTIEGAECVRKSYPDFWEDYEMLGGAITREGNMTYTIFGESHGPAIGVVLEGVPSGVEMDLDFIRAELQRRARGKRPDYGPEGGGRAGDSFRRI